MTTAFQIFDANSLRTISQVFAGRMVDCLVEGTLIALFAGLVSLLARRQSAGARFAIWFSALMAMLAFPVVAIEFPHGPVSSGATSSAHAGILLSSQWAVWLSIAWGSMAAIGIARVGVGLWQLLQLRGSCREIDASRLDPEVKSILAQRGLFSKRRVASLCVSERISVPTVIGLVRPAVVIPTWLLEELSPAELKQILLHELAHLERWDDWTNLAQKLAKTLLFFHPAVWWIEKQVSIEREMACDDAVLAETANPRAYAECLAHLAEKSFARRSLALAQAAVGRVKQTSLRVARILSASRPTSARYRWTSAAAAIAVFAAACSVGIARAPRLVAFEDESQAQQLAENGSGAGGRLEPSPALSPLVLPASLRSTQRAATDRMRPKPRVAPRSFAAHGREPSLAHEQNFKAGDQQPATAPMVSASAADTSTVPVFTSLVFISSSGSAPMRSADLASDSSNDSLTPTPVVFRTDVLYFTDFSRALSPMFVVVLEDQPSQAGRGTAPRIRVWQIVFPLPELGPKHNPIPHKET